MDPEVKPFSKSIGSRTPDTSRFQIDNGSEQVQAEPDWIVFSSGKFGIPEFHI